MAPERPVRNVEAIVPPIAENGELAHFVHEWHGAAGRRDLAAVRALYLPTATITHVVGAHTATLDVDAWMSVLAEQFRAPIDTRYELPLATTFEPGKVRVRYRHSWNSSGYTLVAQKEFTLVRDAGTLKIAADVVVQSKLLRSNSGAGALSGTALVSNDDVMRAFVGRAEVTPPPHGRIALQRGASVWILSADAPPDAVPAGVRAWRGKAVRVISDTGASCRGRLGDLEYVIHMPPGHAEAELESTRDPSPSPPPMSLEVQAQVLWNAALDQYPIAAPLRLEGTSCTGAPLLVRDASLPADRVAKPVPVPREADVIAAFRRQPDYAEMQAMYEEAKGYLHQPTPLWDDWSAPTLRAFRFDDADETLVSLTLYSDGCGDYTPSIWIVLGVRDSGEIVVRKPFSGSSPVSTLLIVDLGSDGRLEYLGKMRDDEIVLVDSEDDTLDAWPNGWQRGCW